MAEFLLELLCEEIPARMQPRAGDDLVRLVGEQLRQAGLEYESAHSFATPRRLCLVIDGLAQAQPDISEERRGPKSDAPEKALEGFLKSTGLSREQLEVRETEKGSYYYARIEAKGRATADVLAEIVPEVIAKFPWPKSMRWGARRLKWVRPLHGILSLFDGKVVIVEVDGITSGKQTRGHRFMAPELINVSDFADYKKKLAAAKVMLDAAERCKIIAGEAAKAAKAVGCEVVDDPALLEEVAGLVEWPVVLLGDIDRAFMDLPPEVLTAAMRGHQKYFSLVQAKSGEMAPYFVTVSNMAAKDKGAEIVKGNERVLSARLADAKFFWDQDIKVPLADRVGALDGVVFFGDTSLAEKMEKVGDLAAELAGIVDADKKSVGRAAELAKGDLTSGMVGEFPGLQGLMGRYYALSDGEDAAVADAIAEHYSPKGVSDACPEAPISVALALADKVYALAYFFSRDMRPTGSKDPYALRRAAIGILRLIRDSELTGVSLKTLFATAVKKAGPKGADATVIGIEIYHFVFDRYEVLKREMGERFDLLKAVRENGDDDVMRVEKRIAALNEFLGTDDGSNLLVAYKRAANIVEIESNKKADEFYIGKVDENLISNGQAEEKALYAALMDVDGRARIALDAEDFVSAMEAMAKLRKPVDEFFDNVTVNCDEQYMRINRLNLLSEIKATMELVADFSKIEG